MTDMFYQCSSLSSLPDISNWNNNKNNITNMSGIFSEYSSLSSIDISKWNTINVTNMNISENSLPFKSSSYSANYSK